MANADAAFGFRPIGRNGGPYNGPLQRVFIPSTATTTDFFVGDIVKLGGSASTDGYATVDIVTAAGDIPYGVITSFEANPNNLSQQYYVKGTAGGRYAKVVLCDEAVFEVQSNGVMTATDVGGNIDYALGAGSTVTGQSGYEIIAANVTTTVGDVLQIQGFVDRADNDLTLTNSKVIVKFNDAATHPDRLGLAT
jgi:hypothetical protein